MEKTIDGRSIIRDYTKGKMSTRPEYYSGRGAIRSDLNSELLEMVYGGMKREVGDKAAKNFVNFVAQFDRLAATTFLNDFYAWCDAGCPDSRPRTHTPIDEMDVGPDREGRDVIGMAALFSWMGGGSDRDETPFIRGSFLRNHKKELNGDFPDGSTFVYNP